MTRHFCDICGSELLEHNSPKNNNTNNHLASEPGTKLMFEIMTGFAGTWNAGEFCKYCIIDAVNKLDDRPKVSPL